MNVIDQSYPEHSQGSETGMTTHAMLMHLRAVLSDPNDTTREQFKDDGWYTPLWMAGTSVTDANGQVAMNFSLAKQDGDEPPVLITYLDESQARQDNPGGDVICLNLSLLRLLAHEQTIDLGVLDGEDEELMAHSQFLRLLDYMTFKDDLLSRNMKADNLFLERLNAFILQACRYCELQPDIRCLHLAAMGLGATPMQAILLIDANNALIHENHLEKMYAKQMFPGDAFKVMDRLAPKQQDVLKEISKLEPVYTQQASVGWWARLINRSKQPRAGVLLISVSSEAESS